jgi:hypothetical protein
MGEKIFNVFVSSTYTDLADERRHVREALSKAGFFVTVMEMFPASNRTQLDFIKKMIDRCDYYVLIVGGRYGSLAENDISYTENEYEYALSKGMPILSFLHKSPDTIESGKTESSKKTAAKLRKFREKLQKGRTVDYWTQPHELSLMVVASIHAASDTPVVGWVRGNNTIGKSENKEDSATNSTIDIFRFKSIKKWQHSWGITSEKYIGTYIFYYRTLSSTGTVAVCLLEIKPDANGIIEFRLYNVDDRDVVAESVTIYTYTGFLFPINDCVYLFADEASSDEMMCIVLSSSQVSPPSNLFGHMMAVGVRPGVRVPAGSNAVAIFKARDFPGLEKMRPYLGIVPDDQIPKNIRSLLKIE